MPAFVMSGLMTGLLIALIDAVAVVVPGALGINAEVIEMLDLVANIALYSYLGLRVGRTTGVLRDAAEAGVIAAVVAATVGVAVTAVVGGDPAGGSLVQGAIRTFALNVALGGVLAVMNGWIGTKAHQSGPARRS